MEKIRPVKTVPGMEERGKRRMVEGVNSSMIYLIYYKKICKCHNVPTPSTTIKKKKEKAIGYAMQQNKHD
jgi:hypothetical protein